MADSLDSGSSVHSGRAGSSPASRTSVGASRTACSVFLCLLSVSARSRSLIQSSASVQASKQKGLPSGIPGRQALLAMFLLQLLSDFLSPFKAPHRFFAVPLLSVYAQHLVVLFFHGGLQGLVGDAAAGDNGCAGLMAHLRLFHALQLLQGLLHSGLAVGTHHAFDLHGSCHGFYLLALPGFFIVFVFVFYISVPFGGMYVQQIQPQGIGHHAEAAEAHGRCGYHGTEAYAQARQSPRRHRDADAVIEEGPEQILVDVPQGSSPQAYGGAQVH